MSYSYPSLPSPQATARSRDDASREIESLLWMAAGAAWTFVALKAWMQSKRSEARRRLHTVSDRLLTQVFPDGIRL